MDGKALANIVDIECKKHGMSKAEFYKRVGLSAASFHGWKNGAKPSQRYITAIEELFGITLNEREETDPREDLRDDLRILLHSASDLPPSSVYALISQIEKMKEDAT
jgi:ribosome-binding protein aMBF1 (putative translation factor)